MKFIERPIYNIKNIEWGAIVWVGFWMTLLSAWVIPAEAQMGFVKSIKFLFSTNFYEVKEVSVPNDIIYSTTMLSQGLNNVYKLLNVGKVILWAMTIIMVLAFLFKNPKLNKQTLSGNISKRQ